jgi:hypothetical protein
MNTFLFRSSACSVCVRHHSRRRSEWEPRAQPHDKFKTPSKAVALCLPPSLPEFPQEPRCPCPALPGFARWRVCPTDQSSNRRENHQKAGSGTQRPARPTSACESNQSISRFEHHKQTHASSWQPETHRWHCLLTSASYSRPGAAAQYSRHPPPICRLRPPRSSLHPAATTAWILQDAEVLIRNQRRGSTADPLLATLPGRPWTALRSAAASELPAHGAA